LLRIFSNFSFFKLALIMLFASITLPANSLSLPFEAKSPSASGSFLAGQQAFKDLRTKQAARFFLDASESDWDNIAIVQNAFIALVADGRIEDAAAIAQHLIELNPNHEIARLLLGTIAIKERRYTSAINQLNKVETGNYTAISAIILKAWALVGEKNFPASQPLIDELSKAGLDDFLIFHKTLMADVAGNRNLALQYAARAYKNDKYVSKTVETYARILANSSRFEEALAIIDAYKNEGLGHPIINDIEEDIIANIRPGKIASNVQMGAAEMYHSIGVALANEGRTRIAMSFFRLGLYLNPKAQSITMALAKLLEKAYLYDEANAIYNSLDISSVLKNKANVNIALNLNASGAREEAIRKLSNIVATQPDNLDAVSVLGDFYRYEEQYKDAIKAYTKALKIVDGNRPQDWRFYYVRGIAYERSDNWKKAETDFLKALKLNPGQPQVLNYLGYTWVDKGMKLKPALKLIRQAVEESHNDGYIVDSLGWAYYKLNRIKQAVETLEQAVSLLPNDPEINDHLGDAYWKAGRKLEATFQWKIAIDVDEKGDVTLRSEEKLKDPIEYFKNQ